MSSKRHVAGYAVLGVIATVVVSIAAYAAFALVFLMCDGDGGSPYAAPLSPRGQACNGLGPLLTGLSCLAAVAVTIAGGAWGGRLRRVRWTILGAVAGLALAGTPLGVMSALSPNCSDPSSSAVGCESY